MEKITVKGAKMILENGMGYLNVQHSTSDHQFHNFLVDVLLEFGLVKYEVRIETKCDAVGQFNIHSTAYDMDDWQFADSVSSDWSIEDDEGISF